MSHRVAGSPSREAVGAANRNPRRGIHCGLAWKLPCLRSDDRALTSKAVRASLLQNARLRSVAACTMGLLWVTIPAE